jgi:ribosomal-protein-alanine N-acetyltransferase
MKLNAMKNYPNLETERLLIRPTTIEDAPFLYELMNSPKWIQFIGDQKMDTVDKVKTYIEEIMLPQFTKLGFTNNTLILKDTNEKIGICGLYCRGNYPEELELGFALLPEFEQKGFGSESAARLIEFGFTILSTQRIKAITNFYNLDSQKLLLKLSFSFVKYEIEDSGEGVKIYILSK